MKPYFNQMEVMRQLLVSCIVNFISSCIDCSRKLSISQNFCTSETRHSQWLHVSWNFRLRVSPRSTNCKPKLFPIMLQDIGFFICCFFHRYIRFWLDRNKLIALINLWNRTRERLHFTPSKKTVIPSRWPIGLLMALSIAENLSHDILSASTSNYG